MTPTPNKYGVYSDEDAELINFHTKTAKGWCSPRAECEVAVIEVAPDQWLASASYNFTLGDFGGMHSPLTKSRNGNCFTSREEAVRTKLNYLTEIFSNKIKRGPTGCTSENQLAECRKLLHQIQQYSGLPDDEGQTDMFAI
jgi:hypothetical protein